MNEMVDAICSEIKIKKYRLANQQVGSIYFGGGTPSVLPSASLEKIFNTLTKNFSISDNAEITIEANPDDLDSKKITELRQFPINRFSIGIQSFFNEDLVWMNRAHTAIEAENCIKRSQDAGFDNLSIDLIYGYPLLTNQKWLSNIETTIALQTPHISAYSLTVENKTTLAHAIKTGKQTGLSDEQSAEQFLILTEKLEKAEFEHYEISNYALLGKYAVHNTNYWRGIPYLSIGPSAHGFDGYNRYLNIANNAKYMALLADNKLAETVEELNISDRVNEYIMTSLRTMWGIDLEKMKKEFGSNYAEQTKKKIEQFLDKKQLILNENKICLTQSGKLFADGIAAELFTEY